VTNLANGRDLVVRVNDRGPFVGDRIIDMSEAAARELGFERQGTARVRVQFIRMADDARGRPPEPPAARSQVPRQVVAVAPEARRTLAPPPQPVLVEAAGARCRGRFIQVGAYAETQRAHQIALQLLGLAWPVSLDEGEADRLARIRLGPIDDRQSAAATLRWLKDEGYASAFIVDEAATSAAC
jgi:rare lipoprotein A